MHSINSSTILVDFGLTGLNFFFLLKFFRDESTDDCRSQLACTLKKKMFNFFPNKKKSGVSKFEKEMEAR